MNGRVYFLQAGEGGPIKIGWTAGEPSARMAALQTGNPEPLRLLGSAKGTVGDERAMHERFAAHRMTGEWFRPAPELVAFAAGVAWCNRAEAWYAGDSEPFADDQIRFLRGMVEASTAISTARLILVGLGIEREYDIQTVIDAKGALSLASRDQVRDAFESLRSLFEAQNGLGAEELGARYAAVPEGFRVDDLTDLLRALLRADEAAAEQERF